MLKRTTSHGDVYLTDEEEAALVSEWANTAPSPVLTCTPWQIRKALNQTGLRDAVESAVAVAEQTTKDGWEFATEFRRDDPLLVSMGTALGKTEAELDALFALARSL